MMEQRQSLPTLLMVKHATNSSSPQMTTVTSSARHSKQTKPIELLIKKPATAQGLFETKTPLPKGQHCASIH